MNSIKVTARQAGARYVLFLIVGLVDSYGLADVVVPGLAFLPRGDDLGFATPRRVIDPSSWLGPPKPILLYISTAILFGGKVIIQEAS